MEAGAVDPVPLILGDAIRSMGLGLKVHVTSSAHLEPGQFLSPEHTGHGWVLSRDDFRRLSACIDTAENHPVHGLRAQGVAPLT